MTRTATFTVSLTEAPLVTSYVSYATVAKTAVAGEDFIAAQGSLTFSPGQLTKTVAISVLAKSDRELVFNLKLSNASKLTLYRSGATGVATIAPDNALVSLVNAAKAAKTTYDTAITASTTATDTKTTRKTELDAAQTAYNDALTEQLSASQELINAENSVIAANQTLTNCVILAALNSSYGPLIIIAQSQLDSANAHKTQVQAKVTAANNNVTATNAALSNATSAYASAVTAAENATANLISTKTSFDTAKAAAAAGFVGSTKLEM